MFTSSGVSAEFKIKVLLSLTSYFRLDWLHQSVTPELLHVVKHVVKHVPAYLPSAVFVSGMIICVSLAIYNETWTLCCINFKISKRFYHFL